MASSNFEIPGHLLERLESEREKASQKAAELRTALESAMRVEKALADILEALSLNRLFEALFLLDKELSTERWEPCVKSASIFREIQEQLEESVRKAWLDYPRLLEEEFRRGSLVLDPRSRHPNYKFAAGFMLVKVKKQGKTAVATLTINGRKVSEFPADFETVAQRMRKEEERLFGRPYDGEKLLKTIRSHYLDLVEAQQLPDGSPVEIRGLASSIVKAQKGYKLDEFIVDLSRVAREGPTEIDGRRLELRTTRDDKKGVLLHNLPNFGYVGSLRFVRR